MKKSMFLAAGLALLATGLWAEQRTLKIEIFDRGNTPPGWLENGPAAKWIQKEFGDPNNIKIEWVLVPRAKEVEKLNIMMAAGDAPDLAVTYDAVLVSSYVSKGGLLDLTPYLKSAPNLTKYLGKEVLDWGVWDGKQFAIPGKRQVTGITGTWIRKDWLDKLGLPLPKTTAEYLNALKQIKAKDPGKIGANLTPIATAAPDLNLLYSFYKPSTERDRSAWIGPTSTRPGRDFSIPGAKDGLRVLNQMNADGLFPKDWALWPKNDLNNKNSILSNGYAASFTDNANYLWIYNLMPAVQKNSPEAVWVPIDPFVNSEGKTAKYVYSPFGIYTIVPRFSKNADLVVKYLDWMAVNKNLVKLVYGIEGQHYDVDKDGIVIPRKLSGDQVWELNIFDRAYILNGRPYDDLQKVLRAQYLPWLDDKYTAKTFIDHNAYIGKDGIPPVRISNPPDSLDKLGPMLLDKADELIKKIIIVDPKDFDATYDAALKEWLALGAEKVKKDMLAEYDLEHKK